MILLDGNALRDTLLDELATEVASLPEAPRLTVLQVGEDPASGVYIRNKMRACERTGIVGEHLHLPADVTQAELEARMAALSAGAPDGVILQLPLPAHLDENAVMALLDPDKDVDGFHPVNLGRLVAGLPGLLPCTPAGVRELLRRNDIPTRGKHVVVIGRSVIVGKPAALLFLQKHALGDATVTVCHSASADLAEHCRRADILVAAVGRPLLVKGDWIKPGAVVVDVGMNRIEDASAKRGYRFVGDCDFDALRERASAMTPVPGGVGPLTVAMLLRNTVTAFRRRHSLAEA
ncbi:MAG: bifunctional methylenetetrahydrofolate dehydrogenase/methenyltetrahydrofolate cyclohydrolase FolD [Candidatus Krumholzibacteriia bacterium]|nr:bifunctional methylenetetrahydrofolate dehydrogenase/methenyltetrahydrofolate cyclohydrolase FolD [Candidatus Latescibacterota bacterium]